MSIEQKGKGTIECLECEWQTLVPQSVIDGERILSELFYGGIICPGCTLSIPRSMFRLITNSAELTWNKKLNESNSLMWAAMTDGYFWGKGECT